MKKFVAILTVALSLCFASVAFADVDFDPSIYTKEELIGIISTINKYLPKTPNGQVLFEGGGVYVEFRGIHKYGYNYTIDIYLDNSSGKEVYLDLDDPRVNRAKIPLGSNGISILDDSIYLASANYDLIIYTNDLKAYGISAIERLEFTLSLGTGMFGDSFVELPILLLLDVPLDE